MNTVSHRKWEKGTSFFCPAEPRILKLGLGGQSLAAGWGGTSNKFRFHFVARLSL